MKSHEFNKIFADVEYSRHLPPYAVLEDIKNQDIGFSATALYNTEGGELLFNGMRVIALDTPLGTIIFEGPYTPMIGIFIRVKAIMPEPLAKFFGGDLSSVSVETLNLCVKKDFNIAELLQLCV